MKELLFVILFISINSCFGQEYEVPKDYKLILVEDYEPYEKDIIKTTNWLINSPVNQNISKREEANTFLLKWLIGAPKVKISLTEELSKFNCQDCLLIFMAGWAKHDIENNLYDKPRLGIKSGIHSLIKFYIKNRDLLGKDKAIEKLIKMKSKNKLQKYIDNIVLP